MSIDARNIHCVEKYELDKIMLQLHERILDTELKIFDILIENCELVKKIYVLERENRKHIEQLKILNKKLNEKTIEHI
jgi:hypothetical protein